MLWHKEKKLRSINRGFFLLLIYLSFSACEDGIPSNNTSDKSIKESPLPALAIELMPYLEATSIQWLENAAVPVKKAGWTRTQISCKVIELTSQLPDSLPLSTICVELTASLLHPKDTLYCSALFPADKSSPRFKINQLNKGLDQYLRTNDLHQLGNFHWTSLDWAYAFERMKGRISPQQKLQLQQYCRFESSEQACLRDLAKYFFKTR